ncbi:hypothetical protein [Tateyamaria sp.]
MAKNKDGFEAGQSLTHAEIMKAEAARAKRAKKPKPAPKAGDE